MNFKDKLKIINCNLIPLSQQEIEEVTKLANHCQPKKYCFDLNKPFINIIYHKLFEGNFRPL